MQSKVPKVAHTCWESMSSMLKWFRDHQVRVQQYLEEKKPSCTPSPEWLIVIILVEKISAEATKTFRSLQGLTTLLCAQHEGLVKLHTIYSNLLTTQILDGEDELDPMVFCVSRDEKYAVKYESTLQVFEDLGSMLEDLDVSMK